MKRNAYFKSFWEKGSQLAKCSQKRKTELGV